MMWRTLLLGVAPLCHANDQSSTCDQGSTCADGHALLQVQTRVKPRSPLALSADPTSLLESVRDLAHSVKHESPEQVSALVDSITSILNATKPLLKTEHDAAQSQLDAQFAEIKACAGHDSHGTDAVAELARQVAEAEACDAAKAAAKKMENTECQAWNHYADRTRQTFPQCLGNSATAEETYAHVLDWESFVEDELAALRASRKKCSDATKKFEDEKARCEVLSSKYNNTFCDHERSCTLLHACTDHERDVYNKLTTDTRSAMTARQEQFRTISQVECLLQLITTAVQINATIADAEMNKCDDDAAADHLALSISTQDALDACPARESGDPDCPTVVLPPIWSNGSGVTPSSLPAKSLVNSGWEYYHNVICETGAGGTLRKLQARGYQAFAPNCVAFDTRVNIMPNGSAPRGISFQCNSKHNVVFIGLQQAGWGNAHPLASQPDTWDSTSKSNFKRIYDDITFNSRSACDGQECGDKMFKNGFDAAWQCKYNSAIVHYHNAENYWWWRGNDITEDTVLSIMVDGNDFKWYADGKLMYTKTGVGGVRNSDEISGPLWPVVALYRETTDSAIKNFQYLDANGDVLT